MDFRGHNRDNIPNYYRDILSPLFDDKKKCIQFLKQHSLLIDQLICNTCLTPCNMIRKSRLNDGYIWYVTYFDVYMC